MIHTHKPNRDEMRTIREALYARGWRRIMNDGPHITADERGGMWLRADLEDIVEHMGFKVPLVGTVGNRAYAQLWRTNASQPA
jgi:hypothetical protein